MIHETSRKKKYCKIVAEYKIFGAKCQNCDGKNHWANVCRAKMNKNQHEHRVSALKQTNDSDTEIVYLGEQRYMSQVKNEK